MKKVLHVLTNRMVLIALVVLLQSLFLILEFVKFANYYVEIGAACKALSIIVTFYILYKEANPSVKLAWVIPILMFPLLGGILYLLFGHVIVPFSMNKNMEKTNKAVEEALHYKEDIYASRFETNNNPGIEKSFLGQMKYLHDFAQAQVWDNTDSTYLKDGETYWKQLLLDLEKAERFIFLEYFIIAEGEMWDSILAVLKRKADSGVEVRLIYDDIGCVFRLPAGYAQNLKKAGINCVAFNKLVPFVSVVLNNRDHRKIVVIDGNVAYTGGINLADEYIDRKTSTGRWKDVGIRICGDAVWNMTVLFLQMWNSILYTDDSYLKYYSNTEEQIKGTGFVQPFGDTPLDHETVGENIYLNMIGAANEKLYVYTPYLVTDNELTTALCLAAKRDVDVRIVTPGIPDKKEVYYLTQASYRTLMNAGVRIFQYAPGFIHAKCVMCDEKAAIVGTINLDYRSFYHHFECGIYMYNTKCIEDICIDMEEVFAVSEEVDNRFFETHRFKRNILGPILRLFSPLV